MKKRLAVITAIVLAGCLQLQAASVAIVNPSAEANTGAVPTGWTYYADGSYPGATAQTALSRPIAADDGLNIFVLYHAGLTQTLGSTYQSGFTYTMSVDAAKRGDTAYNTGWGFGLYYNNGGTLTEIAKTTGISTWANGTWQQKDLVLTVNAGAAYIGKAIVVKLFAAPTSGTSDFVDNVRLSRGAALPEILTLSPANGATYVATNVNLVATFNMDIVAGSGNILITNLTDGTATTFAVGDAQVTISGATLTIDPDDDLIVNKDYAVLIETGAIENTSGNGFGITDTVTWRFTTNVRASKALVFLIAGQSNAGGVASLYASTNPLFNDYAGSPTTPNSTAEEVGIPLVGAGYPRSDIWKVSSWVDLIPGSGYYTSPYPADLNRHGIELPMAMLLEEKYPGVDKFFIKHGPGGHNLHTQWKATTGPDYITFMNYYNAAIQDLEGRYAEVEVVGLYWDQGESDVSQAAAYQQNLTDLFAAFRNDTGIADLPIYVRKMMFNDQYIPIAAAQTAVTSADPNAQLLDIDLGSDAANFLEWAWLYGNGHLSSKAFLELSNRILAAGAGGIPWTNPGESGVTATSAWAVATVNTNLEGAVLVWDTTDHGTASTNDWPNRVSLGSWSSGEDVTGQMTGLLANTTYSWRFYGFNAATNEWIYSQTFTTLAAPPATMSLVHHYPFDSDATDAAGSVNGTLVGGASINTVSGGSPVGGGYLDLDGTNDWVDFGANILTPTGSTATEPLTIAGWVRFDTDSPGYFYSEFGGPNNYSYSFYGNADVNQSYSIALDQYPSTPSDFFMANGAGFNDNGWHHIAYVQNPADSAKRQYYIDGDLLASDAEIEMYTGSTPTSVRIGVRADGLVPLDGAIDDMAFWHEALSADEMKCLYDVADILGYDAGEFDPLKQLHDIATGSITNGGLVWTVATGLTGSSAGLSGSNPTYSLLLDVTAGTGLTSASKTTTTFMSLNAPGDFVEISQTNRAATVPFAWWTAIDRNPRDKGQSFLVGSGGMALDKITVNIARLDTAGYDGQDVIVKLFTLSNGSDFTPDSVVYSATLTLPAGMKAAFDAGQTYLTFDIDDLTLSAGQYGFMLQHAAMQTASDLMFLAAGPTSGYADGIGINLESSRSTYSGLTYWTGAYVSADLEFYLQGTAIVVPDLAAPMLVGDRTDPADNEDHIDPAANLSAFFNEPVFAGTGNIELFKSDGTLVESLAVSDVTAPGTVSFSANSLTIDPASVLDLGVEYYVLIPATAVKDGADNFFAGISDTNAWSFTTLSEVHSNYWYQSSISTNGGGPLDLVAELNYDNSHSNAPIAVVMHGYSGTSGLLDTVSSNAQHLRDKGFFVISVAMRERDGSDGVRDSGGLEVFDIYDAVESVIADFPSLVNTNIVYITGYSGGGGNTMSALTKFPDYFNAGCAQFGMADYGYDPIDGWYVDGAGSRTERLDIDVGDPTSGATNVVDRYHARASNLASLNNPYSEIHLFVNNNETICPPVNDTSYLSNAVAGESYPGEFMNITVHIGVSGTYEDFNGNGTNEIDELQYWPHGYPPASQQDAAEQWFMDRLLSGQIPRPILNNDDLLFVAGFVKTSVFECWVGDGQEGAAELSYHLSDTNMMFDTSIVSLDKGHPLRLVVDTSRFAGQQVAVLVNDEVVESFVGGGLWSTTVQHADNLKLILSGYDTWAASYGLTGADPAAVNNAAGINNLTAYGLGLNPTNGAAVDGALPVLDSGAGGLVYVMARRNDDPSLTFHLLTASNLVDGVWCTNNTPADYTVSGTNTVGRFDFVTHVIDTTDCTKFIKPLVAQ